MKEHAETISDIFFNHFPHGQARGRRKSLLFSWVKKRILPFKGQLLSGAAGLGIGTFFLLAVYFFCFQLAEHGWQ